LNAASATAQEVVDSVGTVGFDVALEPASAAWTAGGTVGAAGLLAVVVAGAAGAVALADGLPRVAAAGSAGAKSAGAMVVNDAVVVGTAGRG
jgi:hypothetical protein